jgi:hypothetical protein
MAIRQQAICGVMALSLNACGIDGGFNPKKDPDTTPTGSTPTGTLGPFIGIEHFNRNYFGLVDVSRSDLIGAIESNATFMLTPPEAEGEDNEFESAENVDPCYVLEDRISLGEGNKLILRFRVNTEACGESTSDPSKVSQSISQRAYAEYKCSDVDVRRFEGRRASDWLFKSMCGNDSEEQRLLHLEQTTTYRQGQGVVVKINHLAVMASNGGHCVTTRQEGLVRMNDCGQFSTITYGQPQNKSVIVLQKYVGKDLEGRIGRDFYHAGAFDVTLNHWRGQLSYGAFGVTTGEQPPVYEFTKEGTQERLNGIYRFLPNRENASPEEELLPEE